MALEDEAVSIRSKVGLVYAGGSILAGINEEGFRIGGEVRDVKALIEADFPDLPIHILPRVQVPYTGLSENMEPPEMVAVSKAVDYFIDWPTTKSIIILHGSDTPEQTGRGLMGKHRKALEAKGISIFLTWSYNPYPSEDAKGHLRFALKEAAFGNYSPGVYVNSPNRFIPILSAKKETYHGKSMRFYDSEDSIEQGEENNRRMDVFRIANELAQKLGYEGFFVMIAAALNNFDQRYPRHQEHYPGHIIFADTASFGKHTLFELGRTGNKEEWVKEVLNNSLQPELRTPFPGNRAFVWPVNRAMEPGRVEPTIQGLFPEVEACILTLNHSGTADTARPDFSIASDVTRMRENQGIVTFGVTETGEPVNFGNGAYVTARDLLNAGVFPLSMHEKVAWVKMYAALDRGLKGPDLVEFMYRHFQKDEFTGSVDKEAVYQAATKYDWRRSVVLD